MSHADLVKFYVFHIKQQKKFDNICVNLKNQLILLRINKQQL